MKAKLVVLAIVTAIALVPTATATTQGASSRETFIFLGQFQAHIGIVATAFTYAGEAGANLTDTASLAKFASIFSTLEIVEQELSALRPPLLFVETHRLFLLSVSTMADVADFCRAAIMDLNPLGLDACTATLGESLTYMNLAQEELAKVVDAVGALPD